MWMIVLMLFGPCAVGLMGALVTRFLWLRDLPRLGRTAFATTLLAGILPLFAFLVLRLLGWSAPSGPSASVADLHELARFRAAFPLALGIIAVLLLSVRHPHRARSTSADISRRTLRTFLSAWWIAGVLAVSALVIGLSVALGSFSRPDGEGRYTQRWVSIGTNGMLSGFGTYGWYYSVPAMVALVLLLTVAAIAWWSIPRPAWDAPVEQDIARRRLRAENVGRAALGAVLVHLGYVVGQLRGAASTFSELLSSHEGTITIPSPLAAMEPVFAWASPAAEAVGLAMWFLIVLSAVPSPARRMAPSPSFAP